ncbi:DUF2813 domain-containing protein [bacterium]|nr:DUF2813 domain-containing protein [bacterium]
MFILSNLSVNNFRAIHSIDLSFERNVTVLIGENGCGKSSIVNALEAVLGRNVSKDGTFNIKATDFHRHTFDQPQSTEISIIVSFEGKRAVTESAPVEDLGFNSLDKFYIPQFICEESESQQCIKFSLCAYAYLGDDNSVTYDFSFKNNLGEVVELEDKLSYLITLKTVAPFLRIRPGALLPPTSQDGGMNSIFSQAYSELTENSQCNAEEFIEQNRDKLEIELSKLEGLLSHQKGNQIYNEDDRPLNFSFENSNNDAYRRKLMEEHKHSLALIENRLSAPLSTTSNVTIDEIDTRARERDYNRFTALLRGCGARSLAMLAFADSFFKVQASNIPNGDYYPILSVEEPEAFLHPLMLTSVWSLLDRMFPQKIVMTNNSDLLSAIALTNIRRIVRTPEGIATVYRVRPGNMHINDLRRIAYHLRIRRGTAMFMRFWLLVEGETEYWLIPEIARAMGYDLWSEGIEFVEFAQCGLGPLASLANELGISWHLLADGDKAGKTYGKQAHPYAVKEGLGKVTVLEQLDIENCFWENGYENVFRMIAGEAEGGQKKAEKSKDIIKRAIRIASKPGLALALGRAMQEPGSPGIPSQLSEMIVDAVRTARKQGRQ